MKITFLGTAGAHPYPAPHCVCSNCQQARLLGGKSIRRRASLLVNDDLLIDPGPDLAAASQELEVPLTGVRFCLVTHAHGDHLDVSHLAARCSGASVFAMDMLHLYASPETLQIASDLLKEQDPGLDLLSHETQKLLGLEVHKVAPFKTFSVGDYRVTALPANHEPEMGSLLYSVETGGRALFYGTDTAALYEQTWQAFHQFKLQFDLVILDHSNRPEVADRHLLSSQFSDHVKRFKREDLLKEEGRVFATHIYHASNPAHPQLEEFAVRGGYEAAYDGLVIEV